MKSISSKIVAFLLAFTVTMPVFADRGTAVGLVTSIDVHMSNWQSTNVNQTGFLFISMDELPTTCSHSRAAIPTTHPLYETIYDMAVTAKINNTSLKIHYSDDCSYRSNALDMLIVGLPQ